MMILIWALIMYIVLSATVVTLAYIVSSMAFLAFVSTHSLAYPVANDIDFLHDIENPMMPDRQQWLNDYAWTEYTIEEISQGIPLKRLTNNIF